MRESRHVDWCKAAVCCTCQCMQGVHAGYYYNVASYACQNRRPRVLQHKSAQLLSQHNPYKLSFMDQHNRLPAITFFPSCWKHCTVPVWLAAYSTPSSVLSRQKLTTGSSSSSESARLSSMLYAYCSCRLSIAAVSRWIAGCHQLVPAQHSRGPQGRVMVANV